MGIFSRSSSKTSLPWTEILSVEQLHEVIGTTHEKPVLLFKHSTRCAISSMSLNSFEREWTSGNELSGIYFVDLLRNRDVSNEIAVVTGVMHQSPQVIVLKGSEVIYDASHSSIEASRIDSILKKG